MLKFIVRPLLHVLPTGVAASVAMLLASLAVRMRLKPRDREALARGQQLAWGPRGKHVAYAWGRGPLVVLIHGWGGSAAQMVPLAEHLAWMGFRAVAPDISGHGASPGLRITFDRFIRDVDQLTRDLGEQPQALIGHSAGGMTLMAARRAHRLRTRSFVCLNAPLYPYPPIAAIRKAVAPPEAVLRCCQHRYAAQFDTALDDLQAGVLYTEANVPLMLVYDRDDDQVHHSDASAIAQVWPDSQTVFTDGLGHHRTLWDDAVLVAVGDFVAAHSAAGCERAA